MIPYGRQEVTQADIEAVTAVLRSDFLTQGPVIGRFEEAVGARVGAPHAVAVSSATAALHVACLALGLGPGDLLWTVPNTFVASANCARYCGADVDFVDINPVTWNLSVARLREKLVAGKRAGRLPKVVVPVHFGGQPTEQEEIAVLASEFGFRVVEDASHSIGASRNGEPVGSCRWSDITVFSFHPIKIITTGEGGMAMAGDPDLGARMRSLRSHGITRDPQAMVRPSPGQWYYEQLALGFNYRITDFQAALGLSQLARLDSLVARRNEMAGRYDEAFAELAIQLPVVSPGSISAFHLYVIRLRKGRDAVFAELRSRGIGVNVHYIPVHLQPYYRDLGFAEGHCTEAEAFGAQAITLPLHPGLSEADQQFVIEAVKSIVG